MSNFLCGKAVRALAASALALCLTAVLTAQGQTWTVDVNNGPGTDFTTISAAVAAAQPHDRIIVRIGLYVEDVLIDKGITLVGWNATTYPMTVPADPFGSAIQGTLGVINIPNDQTVVVSGLSVAPSGPGGVSVGLFNSLGPMVLDRVVIPNGTLLISYGQDVLLQDVRIRAPQAGASPPLSGITVVYSWVQANDLDVIGGNLGGEPDYYPAGGAALEVIYPSIVGLARPKLVGGSGGGPWITSASTPSGGPGIRAVGGTIAIVDEQSAADYILGGAGGERGVGSAVSIPSGNGGNAIEVDAAGLVINKKPMTLTPGTFGANMAGGPLGSSGAASFTAGGGVYNSIVDVPALFRVTGSTVAGGFLTITFQSAAPGLFCAMGATSDFDLTAFTASLQFSAGSPNHVEFFTTGTSNANSVLEFYAILPNPLDTLIGASGMFQGADVVNNIAFLSNPAVVVAGF